MANRVFISMKTFDDRGNHLCNSTVEGYVRKSDAMEDLRLVGFVPLSTVCDFMRPTGKRPRVWIKYNEDGTETLAYLVRRY